MNHGLEAHVDLTAANDLSDIGRVIGLKQSNLEALFVEEPLGLSQIQRGVVRRSVPLVHLATVLSYVQMFHHLQLHAIALPVGEESNLVSGHLDDYDSRRDCNCKWSGGTSQHNKNQDPFIHLS